MSDAQGLELDRVEGAPHPRETCVLHGQSLAEAQFLAAFNAGRLHHAWLISGARGIGKATLAWRIARFLLAQPVGGDGLFGAPPPLKTLDIDPAHPVIARTLALSEARLKLIRRDWNDEDKKYDTTITVRRIRALKSFFQLSAPDGGRRVVIIDSMDEMGPNAANALLKVLEEPPTDCVLLLVCHRPSRLLPTIRSRCRELRCATLMPQDLAAAITAAGGGAGNPVALAELSGGSVGEAIRLANLDGLATYAAIVALFAGRPLNRPRALALAERVAGRRAEPVFDLILTLMDHFLARLARTGATGAPPPEAAPGEAALFARLAPDQTAARLWADLHQTLGAKAQAGKAVNLDPAALVLDMVLKVDDTAAGWAARRGPR